MASFLVCAGLWRFEGAAPDPLDECKMPLKKPSIELRPRNISSPGKIRPKRGSTVEVAMNEAFDECPNRKN
jgi:hypothetical protein